MFIFFKKRMSTANQGGVTELKDLISRCKSSTADESVYIQETCTRIEKSECDVLNARLEEQTNLVEFYKSRGDTYKKRISKLERSNKELLDEREKLAGDYDSLRGENRLLKDRVEDLNETKVSLRNILEEKAHEIEEISKETDDLNRTIKKLREDLKNSKCQYEQEISGKGI